MSFILKYYIMDNENRKESGGVLNNVILIGRTVEDLKVVTTESGLKLAGWCLSASSFKN